MLLDTAFSNYWLVVEDGDDDFLLLQRAAARIKPEPKLHRVKDGSEAQQYLAGAGQFADRDCFPLPGLILSDLKMPGMNGLELLAWVKSQPPLRPIPFVLFTSSNLQCDRERAQAMGCDHYLVKLLNTADSVKALQELLEHR